MGDGVQHAPRRSKNAFRSDKKKKRDVAGSALPSTVHRPGGPPKPPQDHSVKGKKPDVMGLLHFAEETVGGVFGMLKAANTNSTDHAKAQPPAPAPAPGLDPKIKDAMDNVRAIAETQTLIATMGKVGDQRGRWQFLNTLDRVDDPAVRAKMKKQFEEQTGQTLDHFIDTAGFYSKRDREQAKDMLSDERGETEKKLAEQARSDPEAYEKKKLQAIKWASTVLQTTRKDDVDHDADAKPIYDALGPRTPEEIELIRAEIRKQTGGRTAYQEIDKTLSGGTEDEALAGLKGNKVNAVAAGIKNADGNAKRIEELLRTLSPDEITKLNVTSPVTTIIAIQSIEPSQRGTIGALLSNDKASADAAHIADLFKKPEDGLEMDGIKLTKQSQQNLDNRKPDNIIKELRAMSPEAIRAAKDAWNKDPANKDKQWSEMIEERFEGGDSNMLMRIRALSEGNLVEERAYALREGMRKQNQELIEGALANPDLDSKDEEKKAKAIAEKQELEATVLRLDVEANRGAAAMTGKDPNAVVGRPMEAQLADYYEEYGDKIPKPKDLDSMLELAKGEERLKAKRRAEASENHIVTNEIVETGDVSQVTKVIRAEKKGDLETKAQLLENLESKDERVKLEEEYKKRFPADSGKGIYDDPRAKEFAAMADFKKRMGDERPLSEIQKEIADDGRNANEHRIHNVALHGAKVERSPYLEYTLQAEQLERQHSDSLESSEMMRDMMGGNAGTEDLARHQLQNMKESFVEKTNPFDMTPPNLKEGVSEAEFRERDKSMTSTLEVQRSEKIKHGERLAMAFSTIAKIAALLAGQPHLVFLIDAAAGLTEMAIKSAAMGNDYDSSLDEKMFGLTMAVDALTMGAGKYFSGAASKLDDVVAAEKAGVRVGTDVVEQATTSEAKRELAEEGIKQAAQAEAKVAGSVMKSADDTVEGGMAMAKTEQAIAKAESKVVGEAAEGSAEKGLKTLQRQEMAVNLGIGAGQTAAASQIQGENTDDMLFGIMRGMLGSLVPNLAGGKIDKMLGTGKLGTVVKSGLNIASDMTLGGSDPLMALAGATGNAIQARKAQKQQKGAGHDEHVMSHLAEEPTYRSTADDDAPVAKKATESVDPNVLAHSHNAEPDHLVKAAVDEGHLAKKPPEETPGKNVGPDEATKPVGDVDPSRATHTGSPETGSSRNPFNEPTKDPAAYRVAANSPQQIEQATQHHAKLSPDDQARHKDLVNGLENKAQQVLVERALASGRSLDEIQSLATAMRGKTDAQVLREFSGDGIAQFYGHSCVPTAYQIALAERDPVYAHHLKTHPEEMRQAQANPIILNGGALTERKDMHDPPPALAKQMDPETRQQFDASFRDQPNGGEGSKGIEPTLMPDREIHKALEKATGTKYEVITNAAEPHEKAGAGDYAHVPFDRIDAAIAANQPVMYSQMGHEYTIVGRSEAPDGKKMYVVTDPGGARTTLVDPNQFDVLPMISITLPVSDANAKRPIASDAQPTGRTHAGGIDDDADRSRSTADDELNLPTSLTDTNNEFPRQVTEQREAPLAAARAIPGTDFHGNARPSPEPDLVRGKANEAAKRYAKFVRGEAADDGSIDIKLPGGGPRKIRVVVEPPISENAAPVSHYNEHELAGTGEIVIRVSDRAGDDHIDRAVAHDLAEIRHRLVNPDSNGPDQLVGGKAPDGPLSAHDVGRLAEMEVLGDQILAAKGDPERQKKLREDGKALLEHLGMDRDADGSSERWDRVQNSGQKKGEFGNRTENSARVITGGEINLKKPTPAVSASPYGENVSAERVESLGKSDNLSGEEKARLAHLKQQASTRKLDSQEIAALEILVAVDRVPNPVQLARAQERAALLDEAGGAEHAALPAVPEDAVILDTQLLSALNKDPDARKDEEKVFITQLQDDTLHATDFSLLDEPDVDRPRGDRSHPDVGRVPLKVSRDSEAYQGMLETLTRYNVGKGDGSGDRIIVADAFFARSEGDRATLKTADEHIVKSLLRMTGKNPALLGDKVFDVLTRDGSDPVFDVDINGQKLRVEVVRGPKVAPNV